MRGDNTAADVQAKANSSGRAAPVGWIGNHDPRELFIANLHEARGEYNVFHAYSRALAQTLFDARVSRNVYCVNVAAVIAALPLKMLWKPLRRGEFGEADLATAAFTIFLYPRMPGCAADSDDHLHRGRNMDTRTGRFPMPLPGVTKGL